MINKQNHQSLPKHCMSDTAPVTQPVPWQWNCISSIKICAHQKKISNWKFSSSWKQNWELTKLLQKNSCRVNETSLAEPSQQQNREQQGSAQFALHQGSIKPRWAHLPQTIYTRQQHSGQGATTAPGTTSLWSPSQEKHHRSSNTPASLFSSGEQMRGSPLSWTPLASCCWSPGKASSPPVTTNSSFSSCPRGYSDPAPWFLSLLLGLDFPTIFPPTPVCNYLENP